MKLQLNTANVKFYLNFIFILLIVVLLVFFLKVIVKILSFKQQTQIQYKTIVPDSKIKDKIFMVQCYYYLLNISLYLFKIISAAHLIWLCIKAKLTVEPNAVLDVLVKYS